ncbi:MAG TPA: MATE family efflux transporter [Candidatus Angelobacter sp.]|nr:MATE family efflux transporter [Candidatus Angelobacter sp.]
MAQVQTIPAALPVEGRPLMSTFERMTAISKLALPISLAQGSTLLMALIDLAMVGRLGNKAVAALGLSVFSNSLILASVEGLASSIRGIVARRRGERSTEARCLPLTAGLLIALVVGIPLAAICFLLSPFLFSLLSSDPEITKIGIPLLRTLNLGIAAVGIQYAFSGYWTGIEKPRVYMLVVLFMTSLNTLLNYALIFGHFGAPALGATGAAISTVVSLYLGAIVHCLILHFFFRNDGFLSARPERALVMRIVRLGLPVNVAAFFFASGYVVFLRMVGQVGTAELAAANVLVRVTMVLGILSTSLGRASATLVSRTVGEGDLEGATQWGWAAGKLGVIGITLLGLPMLLFPKAFLSIFISDPHTISIANIPLRLEGATAGAFSLIYVFGYTLNSLGDGKRIMIVSLTTQWLLFLPVVWFVGPYLHYGLLQLWFVQMAYSLLATALITGLWMDGKWKTIKI